MLKKFYLPVLFVLTLGFSAEAQNEVGGYILTSWTGILEPSPNTEIPGETITINTQNSENDFYSKNFTMSRGIGLNFIHFFKGKKDTRKHSRFGYRIDLLYTGQSQKWTVNYRENGEIKPWNGQIRMDYFKLNPNFEISHPYSKHLSVILFGGPQLGMLFDYDGGLMAYRRLESHDQFFLPFQDRGYWKRFTLDAVWGVGVDYEFTKWINLSGGIRGDINITTANKPNEVINGYKLLDLDSETNAFRNYNISIFLGAEYTLHKPEHAKTRF